MKISSVSITASTEGSDAEPWRLQIVFALIQQFTERGRAGRQAEAEKIKRGQRRDRAVQHERHKVRVATIAFGSTCLNMIGESRAPKALAART